LRPLKASQRSREMLKKINYLKKRKN